MAKEPMRVLVTGAAGGFPYLLYLPKGPARCRPCWSVCESVGTLPASHCRSLGSSGAASPTRKLGVTFSCVLVLDVETSVRAESSRVVSRRANRLCPGPHDLTRPHAGP